MASASVAGDIFSCGFDSDVAAELDVFIKGCISVFMSIFELSYGHFSFSAVQR